MRFITVQDPVLLLDETDRPMRETDPYSTATPKTLRDCAAVSHHKFIMGYLVNEAKVTPAQGQGQQPTVTPKIGVGYEGFKRTGKLDRAFKRAQPGDVVAIEDEDWKIVKTILDEKEGLFPSLGAQLMPFFSAWMDAPDKRPEAPVNGESKPAHAQTQAPA